MAFSKWVIFGMYKWNENVVYLAKTYEMKEHPHMGLLDILNRYYAEYRHRV